MGRSGIFGIFEIFGNMGDFWGSVDRGRRGRSGIFEIFGSVLFPVRSKVLGLWDYFSF